MYFMANASAELAKTLDSFGLSEKEVSAYLAILEMGRGTVTEISRKANINRTSGYDILDSLTNRGLVRVSGKEPKQEYVAESPDNIVTLLEKRLAETQRSIEAAKELVPKLKSMHRVEDRPGLVGVPRTQLHQGTRPEDAHPLGHPGREEETLRPRQVVLGKPRDRFE